MKEVFGQELSGQLQQIYNKKEFCHEYTDYHEFIFVCIRVYWCIRGKIIGQNQCLKWRIPVVTMATPLALQYSIESLSRIEPPG